MSLPEQRSKEYVFTALPKAEVDRFTLYLLQLLRLLEAEGTLTAKGQYYLSLAEEEIHRISRRGMMMTLR